jgi:TRAP transporter TAXI family solute receptor
MRLVRLLPTLVLLASLIGAVALVKGQNKSTQRPNTPETGFAVKKPVFGGACKTCPWGVIAGFVKAATQSSGYDVQICYNCAGGPQEARLVAAAKMPPTLQNPRSIDGLEISPPPNGPVDFGATSPLYLWWAYQGTHDFAGEGPKKNLRLLGVIQHPNYLIVAAKADSGITDLREISEKHLRVRILTGTYDVSPDILAYYGLTKESIEAAGGSLASATVPAQRNNFDVIIVNGTLENAPEWNVWYELSQKYELKYLELPDALLARLATKYDMDRENIPVGLLRGVDHPIPTVTSSGDAVYGRTDMPEDFAYAVAKGMDEHQDLLQWTILNLSYNSHTAWKAFGVPLHPGAARYYRERGYMK